MTASTNMKDKTPLVYLLCAVVAIISIWLIGVSVMGGDTAAPASKVVSSENASATVQSPVSSVAAETAAGGASVPVDAALSLAEENARRQAAREARLAELGLLRQERQAPTPAMRVSLHLPAQCDTSKLPAEPDTLFFRHGSAAIKGDSLTTLEQLVTIYRDCDGGQFHLYETSEARSDADAQIARMRHDEVKYFFIQHNVPLERVLVPLQP